MQVHEKLKALRRVKNWSQEKMAEKLEYSLTGYIKIEHGETDLGLKKWEKIAEVLGVNLQKLLGLNENNVFNIVESSNCSTSTNCSILLSETQCAHELEKSRLLLHERDKEIEHLKEIIELLRERK